MRRFVVIVSTVLLLVMSFGVAPAFADGGYVVKSGDTLAMIARLHGVSITQLAQANSIGRNGWVYVGQQLVIPGQAAAAPAGGSSGSSGGSYTVSAGDTLFTIATRHGVSTAALMAANGLSDANLIYSGQRLVIPGGNGQQSYAQPASTVYAADGGEKWIDINLTNQTITAYEGQTPVMSAVVSTGTWEYPTVAGTFEIYSKTPSQAMYGGSGADYYYLPNVPNVMYFYGGYGFHGTYWHSNFGTPMSHGCVNLSQYDAEVLYNWAPIGTKVVSHY